MERALYRLGGVDPEADQRWPVYARSVLAFSLVGVLLLYGLQRVQHLLPLSLGMDPVPPDGAFNTAVSFVTNTNWQWYSGESTMGHLVQMAGLAVQNFVSAAVGIAVAVPPDERYDATLIDTWEMTETALAKGVARGDVLRFEPKPYQALLLRRA